MKKSFLIMFSLMGGVSACAPVIGKLYGVHKLHHFDEERLRQFVSDIDFKGIEVHSFYSDTNSYKKVRELIKDPVLVKALSQPVQMLYFNTSNDLVSLHANCYANGGVAGLNWNTDNRFNQFIPASAIIVDTIGLALEDFARCYPGQEFVSDKKYTIIIYWTLMLEKISRTAIERVVNNAGQFHQSGEISLYLVNNDKAFIP